MTKKTAQSNAQEPRRVALIAKWKDVRCHGGKIDALVLPDGSIIDRSKIFLTMFGRWNWAYEGRFFDSKELAQAAVEARIGGKKI